MKNFRVKLLYRQKTTSQRRVQWKNRMIGGGVTITVTAMGYVLQSDMVRLNAEESQHSPTQYAVHSLAEVVMAEAMSRGTSRLYVQQGEHIL